MDGLIFLDCFNFRLPAGDVEDFNESSFLYKFYFVDLSDFPGVLHPKIMKEESARNI